MPHAAVSERQRNRANQLRRTMTRAETLLWRYLKANRIDELSFRRQVPFRNYIADFVCLSVKLIVELDGVVEIIRKVASSSASTSPPSLTLPHKGGGNGNDRSSNNVNI